MSVLLQCRQLSKEYDDRIILEKVDLDIKQKERLGIVGPNGMGKTTLLNLIAGYLEPTDGYVEWMRPGIQIGYMQQSTDYIDCKGTLSGGERTKEALKQVLHGYHDVLLLDEPTNHLDAQGIRWLVKEVKAFRGTVIIISHDRYFLDQCVTRIIEVDKKKLKEYKGNYSWYREEKKRFFESQLHRYLEQEKSKERIEAQIDNLRQWSSKAHRDSTKKGLETGNKMGRKEYYRAKAKSMDKSIKSRIKRLEKIEVSGIEKPEEEQKVLFQLEEAKKVGKVMLEAKEIAKRYGDRVLFRDTSFYIKRGEKVGIYGPNGCGKSTLLKAIMQQEEVEGTIRLHSARRIGYLSQDVSELDRDCTIIELFQVLNRQMEAQVRTQLYQMGFDSDSLRKKVNVLSLGERMKLKLLMMIREGCEMLILDEPTNHIDLHVREQLEETLKAYIGTVLLVTHDRYMLEKLCDKLLVFENNCIRRYEHGIVAYEERNKKQKEQKKKRQNTAHQLLLENKIAYVIGELSRLESGTEDYQKLDQLYKELMAERNRV